MNRYAMMTLRLKSAVFHALTTSVMVFCCGIILSVLVNHKRNLELIQDSQYLAYLIASDETIRSVLSNPQDVFDTEIMQNRLRRYLDHNPSIDSFAIIDAFKKVLFKIDRPNRVNPSFSLETQPFLSLTSTNSLSPDNMVELPLTADNQDKKELGKIRIQWDLDSESMIVHTLNRLTLIVSGISLILAFLFSYFVILKRYSKEHHRLSSQLGLLVSGDYSNRLEPRSFSRDVAEISTYINRVLSELEEARKQRMLSQDSFRQMERHHHETLRALDKQTKQIEAVYAEVQEGVSRLLSLLSCGLLIVDHEYHIHWMNQPAERLLRFADFDDDILKDERLKRSLAPLVRFRTADKIDDICAWPQPSLGCAASCRIRAITIPTPDDSKLFFIVVEEDSGFPQQHSPEFFSHRLVLDILSHLNDTQTSEDDDSVWRDGDQTKQNQRLWECLSRIERYQKMEKGEVGTVQRIRLAQWLQKIVSEKEAYPDQLHLISQPVESDVQVKVPDLAFYEMVQSVLDIVLSVTRDEENTNNPHKPITIRVYWNARGKPVIEMLIQDCSQQGVHDLKETFGGRRPLHCDQLGGESMNLAQLEHDIQLTLYQFLRQNFRSYVECSYSAGKHLGIVRLVIERFLFNEKPETIEVNQVEPETFTKSSEVSQSEIKTILQNYLGKKDSVFQ